MQLVWAQTYWTQACGTDGCPHLSEGLLQYPPTMLGFLTVVYSLFNASGPYGDVYRAYIAYTISPRIRWLSGGGALSALQQREGPQKIPVLTPAYGGIATRQVQHQSVAKQCGCRIETLKTSYVALRGRSTAPGACGKQSRGAVSETCQTCLNGNTVTRSMVSFGDMRATHMYTHRWPGPPTHLHNLHNMGVYIP